LDRRRILAPVEAVTGRVTARSLTRSAKWLARAVVLFLLTLFPPLAIGFHWNEIGPSNGGPLGLLSFTLALQSVGIVGYLITLRRPANPLGWLMLAIGLVLPVTALLSEIIRALRGSFPAVAGFVAVLQEVTGWMLVGSWLLAVLLFPDGRLPGRVWRVLLWPVALAYLAYEASGTLAKPELNGLPNPLFVPGMRQDQPGSLSLLVFSVGLVAVLVTPVWRWRRALGRERSQLKWIAFAGILGLVLVFVSRDQPLVGLSLTILLFPAAAGIAILRDRLFDIDFVINRTALYGTVAIVLLAAFGVLSALIEQLLSPTLHDQLGLVRPFVAVAVLPAFRPLERRVRPFADRLLPTNERLALLFTDIVGSTDMLSAVGDASWRELLGRYYAQVRAELRRFGGTEVDTTGDGFFATFRDPVAAARCALALIPATADLSIRTRVGLHFGDCDMRGGHPIGINVHVAARVMALADGNTVLVSESCRDALSGAALQFESLGGRKLKGIPGEVHVYRLSAGGPVVIAEREPVPTGAPVAATPQNQ
jgi:class 3 adenylate cyclase